MAWIQLVGAILFMYLIVGTAGYWGLRKRREQTGSLTLRQPRQRQSTK